LLCIVVMPQCSELNTSHGCRPPLSGCMGCEASHVETVHVREKLEGRDDLGKAMSRSLTLSGHPRPAGATRGPAITMRAAKPLAVLALPTGQSTPATAVKAASSGFKRQGRASTNTISIRTPADQATRISPRRAPPPACNHPHLIPHHCNLSYSQ